MGKSSTAPLDYAALMKDIRAQGLKHALEKQPLLKNSGMVAKTLPATYGQMHEGKGLRKVVTSRTTDDDMDEPQQPRSAPHPFKRENPLTDSHLALSGALTSQSGTLPSQPRHRVPSPAKEHTNRSEALGVVEKSGQVKDGERGKVASENSEVEHELQTAAANLSGQRGILYSNKSGPPLPTKPPRLMNGIGVRQGQSPQKKRGDVGQKGGLSLERGGVSLEKGEVSLEKEVNGVRNESEVPGQKTAKPAGQQLGLGSKTQVGGDGGGPRLRAEGLMAPPAADAASLRRQVAALQVELEAHIDGEGRLQTINCQLRERLEAFQSQNRESMARADEELAALHKDLDSTLELQGQLAEKAGKLEREKHYIEATLQKRVADFEAERTVLRAQIDDMSEDVRVKAEATAQAELLKVELDSVLAVRDSLENEVERLAAESQYVKQKAEEYSAELRAMLDKEQREELLHRRWRSALQKRMFAHFRSAVGTQKIRRWHKRAAAKFAARRMLNLGLRFWALAARRSRKMDALITKRQAAFLREVWRLWQLEVSVGGRQRACLSTQRREVLIQSLKKWRQRVAAERVARAREAAAERFCVAGTRRRILRAWRREVGKGRLSLEEEEALGLGAELHYESALKRRALWAWVDWVDDVARPRGVRISRANAQNRRSLLRRAFRAWEDGVDARILKGERKTAARKMANRSLTQRGFEAWLVYRQRKVEIRGKQALADRCYLEHRFRRWHCALLDICAERDARKRGSRLREVILTKVCMRAWVSVAARKKRARAANTRAFAHYLGALRITAWVAWREGLEVSRAEKRAVKDGQIAVLRAALARWKGYHRQCLVKKGLETRARVRARRLQERVLRAALQGWWEVWGLKRQRRKLEALLRERRERGLIRRFFVAWRIAVYEGLRDIHVTVHNEYLESQAKCEEQATRISAVDLENLQLIDRLHALSAEFAQMQAVIKEQRDKNDDLQRSLEEGTILESSLRADADHARGRARALQDEIAALQRVLAGRNEEDTAVEVRHQLEVQGLRKEIERLREKVEEKGAQLEACEEALHEASERLDASAAHSQEKLTNSLEIAAQLRQLLEEKDCHVAALEADKQAAELDVGEMQRKVAAANQTLRDAVDARESRIRELEGQARQNQQEAQKNQIEIQELRIAVERRSAQVRKLEYEVRLLREREQTKADAFISALHVRARSPPAQRPFELTRARSPPPQRPPESARARSPDYLRTPEPARAAPPANGNGFEPRQGLGVEQSVPPRDGRFSPGGKDARREGLTEAGGAVGTSSPGQAFSTPEKPPAFSSHPVVSPQRPATVAFATPEKRPGEAVGAFTSPDKRPGFGQSTVQPSLERDHSAAYAGLSSQRRVHTSRPIEPRVASPSFAADRSPEPRNATSPGYEARATSRQETGASRSPNQQSVPGRQAPLSSTQQAGFARWMPPAARNTTGASVESGPAYRKVQEEKAGLLKSGVQLLSKGPVLRDETRLGLEDERRDAASPSGSDDSAKDLHAEIQKLQARIMDRLKDTPERR